MTFCKTLLEIYAVDNRLLIFTDEMGKLIWNIIYKWSNGIEYLNFMIHVLRNTKCQIVFFSDFIIYFFLVDDPVALIQQNTSMVCLMAILSNTTFVKVFLIK